jgi:hypothetical protein
MRHPLRHLPVFLILACSADGVEDPAEGPVEMPTPPESGEIEETGCQRSFGRTYILDTLEVLPQGEGIDLNGDGTPDNALGFLAGAINPGWVESLAAGLTIFLWDFSDDGLSFFIGFDADVPTDPKNNLAGAGTFLVDSGQFDTACQPLARFDSASQVGQTLDAQTSLWTFRDPEYGLVGLADFRVWGTFSEDFTHLAGRAAGIFTLCGLSAVNFSGPTPGTILEFMINAVAVQADMDRDGDGLERIEGDGGRVVRCVDGDGTVIEGGDCACDPRIADGYSVSFTGSMVTATIVGTAGAE